VSADFVTLDLGNSRLKLRRWRPRAEPHGESARAESAPRARVELCASADLDSSAGLVARVLAELARAPAPAHIALCCVAAPALEAELAAALSARFGAAFVARPEPGLTVALDQPATAGRDRLFAARGALALAHTDAVVVDAGTCVTVDAVRAEPGARGTFLGGAIAPGPRLLAQALARGGARLPEVDVTQGVPALGVPALGRDTLAALRAGVVIGLRGAVRELVLAIEREAGFARPRIVWTGGARSLLLEPPLFADRAQSDEPELVHQGLLAALGAVRT
jgi:type III pantothenate kinase